MSRPAATAAILIGGDSRRMGRDKSTLVVGGRPLLAEICRRLDPLVSEILLVTRPERRESAEQTAPPGSRVICDDLAGRGPLVGIHAALLQSRHDDVLTVACDMPDLQPDLLAALLVDQRGDVVIPRLDTGWEPLLAVYRRSCLPAIAAVLERGPAPVPSFFDQVNVTVWDEAELRRHDPDLRSLANLNFPEDL